MRFISQINYNKINVKNTTNKATWFKNPMSLRLNIPIVGTFVKSNECMNFGKKRV